MTRTQECTNIDEPAKIYIRQHWENTKYHLEDLP